MAFLSTKKTLDTFNLSTAPLGRALQILSIPDMHIAAQIVRMGLCEGSEVIISARLPGGPSVLSMGAIEIALGYDIARHIQVVEVL